MSTYNFRRMKNSGFLSENSVKIATNMNIYITQLIYIKAGQEAVFHQFENVAIPLIAKYNGTLLLRIRPSLDTIIESNTENPYEIHLVEFASEQDFQNFMQDEERKQFLHLKETSIRASILIKGVKL
jgi:uncharacterized protein (DUF1330 family)